MSVHHIHRLLYEYNGFMYERKRLSTEKNVNIDAGKRTKI